MLLLGGNMYWIKRLVQSIDTVKITVGKIQRASVISQTEFATFKEHCITDRDVVHTRLHDHSNTLKRHGEEIATIKEKIKHKDHET